MRKRLPNTNQHLINTKMLGQLTKYLHYHENLLSADHVHREALVSGLRKNRSYGTKTEYFRVL